MIKKIVSGGQTGVDRAALDVAREIGIETGGWCPKGRIAEDGAIAAQYILTETPSAEYAERTEWNVRDSDATLIVDHGFLTSGTAMTRDFAIAMARPFHVVDLSYDRKVPVVLEWLKIHKISTLNVAGPRESKTPGIYNETKAFLSELLKSAR